MEGRERGIVKTGQRATGLGEAPVERFPSAL